MRYWFVLFFLFSLTLDSHAQILTNTDTLYNPKATMVKSPKTASILSAVLPGAGQFYNRKYWKVPIIYAALGTAVYYIGFNTKEYQAARNEYVARLDDDITTVPSQELTDVSIGQIEIDKKFYKRMLDISYASIGIIYLLNIVDASVDAHLFTFDVSEDLTLNWQPTNLSMPDNKNITGVKFSLNF
ncbi:MAG: hypothetical protein ACJAUV_001419 [Flavobacteriales bacterium]|jgi:hypothetical protein